MKSASDRVQRFGNKCWKEMGVLTVIFSAHVLANGQWAIDVWVFTDAGAVIPG